MTYRLAAAGTAPSYTGQYPIAAGVQGYHGTYIPQVWSAKILEQFYDNCCLTEISNADYEGEISNMGDTVHIRTGAHVATFSYIRGMKIPRVQPKPGLIELVVDKGIGYAFDIHPLVGKQADVEYVAQWSRDASMNMKVEVEEDVFADIYSSAHTSNQGATAGRKSSAFDLGTLAAPEAITSNASASDGSTTNAVEYVTRCESVLTEQNVPVTDRFFVGPEWFCQKLRLSELLQVDKTGDGSSPIRNNGLIGRIGTMKIYSSNLLYFFTNASDSNSNCVYPLFGHKSALTFAWQLVLEETLKNPDDFGDIQRGLQVYGYEVVRQEALGTGVIKAA